MRCVGLSAVVAVAWMASAAAACDKNNLNGPTGNPTKTPEAAETIEMGSSYEITWDASTKGTIDIVLLAGPTAQNLTEIAPVATGIPNNGSFTWSVPKADAGLQSTLNSGYGFKLIDLTDCSYQYSPNFGIHDKDAVTSTLTLVEATTSTSYATAPTGTGNVTIPVVSPTGSMSVPPSLRPTPTPQSANAAMPMVTGAAGWNAGAMLVAGVIGAMAL